MAHVAKWMGGSAGGYWAERLAGPPVGVGFREWDGSGWWPVQRGFGEILRYAQDDTRGKRMRCGRRN